MLRKRDGSVGRLGFVRRRTAANNEFDRQDRLFGQRGARVIYHLEQHSGAGLSGGELFGGDGRLSGRDAVEKRSVVKACDGNVLRASATPRLGGIDGAQRETVVSAQYRCHAGMRVEDALGAFGSRNLVIAGGRDHHARLEGKAACSGGMPEGGEACPPRREVLGPPR